VKNFVNFHDKMLTLLSLTGSLRILDSSVQPRTWASLCCWRRVTTSGGGRIGAGSSPCSRAPAAGPTTRAGSTSKWGAGTGTGAGFLLSTTLSLPLSRKPIHAECFGRESLKIKIILKSHNFTWLGCGMQFYYIRSLEKN
jgi:hypothetical protein